MNLFSQIRLALKALMRNKIRSGLTILGIIIGIAAVIAVMAIGEGANVMIQNQMKNMGENVVIIFPGSATSGSFHFGSGSVQTLTVQDSEAIRKECPYIKAVSPIVLGGGQIIYQEKNWSTRFAGVNPDFLTIKSWKVEAGNCIGNSDIKGATKVCVIGKRVVKELFGEEEPIGKTIRIKNMPFKVVGILEKKGTNAMGVDQDDTIIMPWTTLRRVIQNSPFNNVNHIIISLTSMKMLEPAKKDITAILRQRHNLRPNVEDDFSITDMTEISNTITGTTRVISILLAVIASISLIVGGIGIMNIMLVSVTERTREIGLRMAVGAREKDILVQFFVEAIILASIGGILGIILGGVSAHIVSQTNGWPVLISIKSIILACAFSAGVGIFFGFYPAWRASRLDVINALKYE